MHTGDGAAGYVGASQESVDVREPLIISTDVVWWCDGDDTEQGDQEANLPMRLESMTGTKEMEYDQ